MRYRITAIATIAPIAYSRGLCWFRNAIQLESLDEKLFALGRDSGAAMINAAGQIIELLFAGNEMQAYACPMEQFFTL
jgi:hypothetical protein